MKSIILIITAIVLLQSCEKKEVGKNAYVTYQYKQTYCSDPWGMGSNDSLTLVKVGKYLDSLKLFHSGMNIVQTSSPELCAACQCKSGKTIYVSTMPGDSLKNRYLAIGFGQ